MTPPGLVTALPACAAGLYPLEAGVGLLIANGTFLHRSDFTSRFILHGGTSSGTHMAAVDWEAATTALAAGELPCSGGERRILALAQPRTEFPSPSGTPSPAWTTAMREGTAPDAQRARRPHLRDPGFAGSRVLSSASDALAELRPRGSLSRRERAKGSHGVGSLLTASTAAVIAAAIAGLTRIVIVWGPARDEATRPARDSQGHRRTVDPEADRTPRTPPEDSGQRAAPGTRFLAKVTCITSKTRKSRHHHPGSRTSSQSHHQNQRRHEIKRTRALQTKTRRGQRSR